MDSERTDWFDNDCRPAKVLQNLELRLTVIKQQVEEHIKICKNLVLQNNSPDSLTAALAVLKNKNKRYISETHVYLEKVNASESDIIRHTQIQLEADTTITEIEAQLIQGHRNLENVTSKLPKLELIKFKGDVLKWHEFWDRFSSSVHHKNIRNVDKLAYLSNCLVGKAREAIVGLETTDSNYDIALKVLQERFGKKAIVIDAHFSELFKLKTRDDSVMESRRVINEIERHIRVLTSLGEDMSGAYLRNVIIEKFPQDIVKELKMRMKSEEEPIAVIRKHLEHIIYAKESSDQTRTNSFSTEALFTQEERMYKQRKNFTNKLKFYNSDRPNTAQVMGKRKIEDERQNYGKKARFSCIFCGNSHFNDECTKVISVKDRRDKLTGRCYLCLQKGHRLPECRMKNKKCVHCGLTGQHNRCLCPKQTVARTFHQRDESSGILQTAIICLVNKFTSRKYRALLDTGSQRSYITKFVADQLCLDTKEMNALLVYTFGKEKPKEILSPLVEIEIITHDGRKYTIQANVTPFITSGVMCPSEFIQNSSERYLADDGSLGNRVDILIGNDYYTMFMTGERKLVRTGLYVINSSFGWIYSGRMDMEDNNQDMTVVTYCDSGTGKYFTELDPPLKNADIGQLWELETIGIRDSPKTTQQEEVVKHFNQTVKIEEDRYQVKWPYISFPPDLPVNFGLALGRLKGVLQRMDKEMIKEYDQIFKQQLKEGMVEVVKFTPSHEREGPVHYLPHHGVKQEGKKLRIVLDASAKTKGGNSLNECLYKGPLLLEDLTALLIKFRQHCVAITADVEKAFLQLGLQQEDRDVTRMLWLKNIAEGVHEQNLLHLRFCRVPFGIISSPFLLTATIHHHLNQSNPDMQMVEKVAKRCYVDNLVTGTETKEEAVKLYHDTKKTFEGISMNIRDWNSNNKEFLKEIPEEFRDKNDEETKVLGLVWNTKKDILCLKGKKSLVTNKQNGEITKREVLRVIASVYDPCGLMSPIILPCKLFLQSLWKTKENWDAKLSEEKQNQWISLRESLSGVCKYEFPRYLYHLRATDVELHCFTDASVHAYAAVVYLRSCHGRQITVSLVMSKSRLTPLKDNENLKIPRLELLGCTIGVRLMEYVAKALDVDITKQVLWTDSTIVLDWIASNKLLPPFVSRRIEEIKKSKAIKFRYVNSEDNPADIATRKEGDKRMSLWLNGPQFLRKNEEHWPKRPVTQNVFAIVEGPAELEMNDETREAVEEDSENRQVEGEIIESNIDLVDEEDMTIKEKVKQIQRKHFPQELDGKNTSLKMNLNLFKDDEGILRCEGRIGKSMFSYHTKCPILLPGNSDFTSKIIQQIHEENYHVGATHTLSLIREGYWIPQGRNVVKRVLKRCPQCVKHGGGPFKLPDMPQLPEERVKFNKPFDFVGQDYFGPVYVSCQEKTEKRWVVLYTCLSIRAVDMQMVKDLSAEECLMALRRFIAARGVPVMITSDNASYFKLTAEVLSSDYCMKQKIRFKFIPELAPWHGGFYERLIGVVKNCLKRTLDKHALNESQFLTVIKEVEAVLNTRPLTYVSTDQEHILKPSDFLAMGKCLTVEISGEEVLETERMTKTTLIESWKRGVYILKEFEKMFQNQYLLSLRERSQKHKESRVTVKRVPKVGEIVQIKDDASNRMCWKVGKIEEIIKGGDGQVRVAIVKVDNKLYRRSIAHLYPLEIDEDNENSEVIETQDKTETDNDIICKEPGRERNAAKRAKEKILQWTKQLLTHFN